MTNKLSSSTAAIALIFLCANVDGVISRVGAESMTAGPVKKIENSGTNQSGNFGIIQNAGTVNFVQTINVSIAGRAEMVPISAGSVDQALTKEELIKIVARLSTSVAAQNEQQSPPSREEVISAAMQIGRGEYQAAKALLERYRAVGVLIASNLHDSSIPGGVDLAGPAAASFALARIGELEGGDSSVYDHLNEAIKGDPNNLGYKLYLVKYLQKCGRTDEAEMLFAHIRASVDAQRATMGIDDARTLGDVFLGFEDTQSAINMYQISLNADSTKSMGVSFARVYTRQNLAGAQTMLQQFDAAAANFRQALQEYSDAGIDTSETVILWNNIALMYLEAGCTDSAAEWADKVLNTLAANATIQSFILPFARATRGRAEFLKDNADASDLLLRKAIDSTLSAFREHHWRVAQMKTFRAELLLYSSAGSEAATILSDSANLMDEIGRRPSRQYAITRAVFGRAQLSLGKNVSVSDVQKWRHYLKGLPEPRSAAADWRLNLLEAEIGSESNSDRDAIVELLRTSLHLDQSGLLATLLKKKLYLPQLSPAVEQLEQTYGSIDSLKPKPSKICLDPLLP